MALIVGDKIPDFICKDSNGNDFDSKMYIGKQAVVIYFYPKDDTPGCTAQACSFRDNYQYFINMGAEVIGISSDTVNSHIDFKNKFKLPFILLSDENKKIRKMFGVAKDFFGLVDGRTTYVADKNGIIQLIFDSSFAELHIKKSMEILNI